MSRAIDFTKMAAAGNDFLVIDNRRAIFKGNAKKISQVLCDRKRSVGADGVLLLEKSQKADVRMRIFNSDGSQAEMCGNGVRCLAKFAVDRKIAKPKLSIETLAGIIEAQVRGDTVKARMVAPKNLKLNIHVQAEGQTHALHFIDTGVPHAVKMVELLDDVDVRGLGRAIRFHAAFAPRGANVNFVRALSGKEIGVRTYERGVEDETLACGTGSTASALIAALLENVASPVLVSTRGGEILKIYFKKEGQDFSDIYLEGKIKKAFEGRVSL